MAIVVGGVSVDLEASAATYVAEMDKAARATLAATQRMQGTMGRWTQGFNTAERSVNSSLNRIGGGLRTLQGLMAAFGVGLGAREIIRYANSWRMAEAQLRLVSTTAGAATAVHERLFDIAQNLGVGIDGLTTIYTRAARNAESLGVSQEDLLQTTEALGAAIRISGTSANEAQNALIQLSQSFASGVLRGDELRSISEQLPVVLNAIAAATGRTRQEVINYARENGLAADLVIESLQRQRDAWIEQADTVGGTVEQAMTRVLNAIQSVAGRAGEAGAFQPLIDGLNVMADAFGSDAALGNIKAFFAEFDRRLQTTRNEFLRLSYVVSAVLEMRFADAIAAATGKLREFEETVTNITQAQAAALGVPHMRGEAFGPPAPPRVVAGGPVLALRGGAAAGTGASAIKDTGPFTWEKKTAFDPRFKFQRPEQFGPPALSAGEMAEVARGQEMVAVNEELIAQYGMINSAAQTFSQTVAAGFTDAVMQAKSFGDAVMGIAQSLAEAFIQALALQAVTSAVGAAGGGGLLGAIFTAQPRALGGSVSAKTPYMVGERGPELFMPSRAGQIIPNSELRGGGGGGNVIHINARQSTPGTAAAAVNAALRMAPGAVVNAQSRGQMGRGKHPF